jgi:hypothetical protein
MTRAKNNLWSAARWLVVLMTSLGVLAGSSLTFASDVPAPSVCSETCAMKCPCCIKPAESPAPQPVAPNTTRSFEIKSLHLFIAATALLPEPARDPAGERFSSISHTVVPSTPLFLRHRALLI